MSLQFTTVNGRRKRTPTRMSWERMKSRCYYLKDPDYPRYGGRGIVVCERWKNSFFDFLGDMGERPLGTTLDRKDSNGNYDKSNCRWATALEQQRNRQNTRFLTYDDQTKPLAEWAQIYNIRLDILVGRLERNWPIKDALSQPICRQRTRNSLGHFDSVELPR